MPDAADLQDPPALGLDHLHAGSGSRARPATPGRSVVLSRSQAAKLRWSSRCRIRSTTPVWSSYSSALELLERRPWTPAGAGWPGPARRRAGPGWGRFSQRANTGSVSPWMQQGAGDDRERDHQQHLAVLGVLGDHERRGERDHAAHPGPAEQERVRHGGGAGPRPRPDQHEAGGEDPDQPQHDHRDQRRDADRRRSGRAPRSLSARSWISHCACRPISSEDGVLEQERDRAPVDPLRDPRLRGLQDRRLVAEQQPGDHHREHARRVDLLGERRSRERDHQRQPDVEHRVGDPPAHPGDEQERAEADERRRRRRRPRSRRRPPTTSTPDRRRPPSAVRSATSAVASLNSDSPSRIVTIRRGSPMRRPIAVAATASGGATTAPIASAIGQDRPGISSWTTSRRPRS